MVSAIIRATVRIAFRLVGDLAAAELYRSVMRAALDALRRESRRQKRETRLVQTQTRSTRFSHPIWAAFRGPEIYAHLAAKRNALFVEWLWYQQLLKSNGPSNRIGGGPKNGMGARCSVVLSALPGKSLIATGLSGKPGPRAVLGNSMLRWFRHAVPQRHKSSPPSRSHALCFV
jgi:hypothetical protein